GRAVVADVGGGAIRQRVGVGDRVRLGLGIGSINISLAVAQVDVASGTDRDHDTDLPDVSVVIFDVAQRLGVLIVGSQGQDAEVVAGADRPFLLVFSVVLQNLVSGGDTQRAVAVA